MDLFITQQIATDCRRNAIVIRIYKTYMRICTWFHNSNGEKTMIFYNYYYTTHPDYLRALLLLDIALGCKSNTVAVMRTHEENLSKSILKYARYHDIKEIYEMDMSRFFSY